MGRARGQLQQVAMAGFDAVLGSRRGGERGDILAARPTDADRHEMQQLARGVDRGALDEAWELLAAHQDAWERHPLLGELLGRVCDRLSWEARSEYLQTGRSALSALGFLVDEEDPRTFDSPKLQDAFDAGMRGQIVKRVGALMRVGRPATRLLAEAAFRQEFVRVGAAQCFQRREALCKDLLGGPVPVNLADVTAWRSVIDTFMTSPPADRDAVSKALRSSKRAPVNTAAAPRRRQRYLH